MVFPVDQLVLSNVEMREWISGTVKRVLWRYRNEPGYQIDDAVGDVMRVVGPIGHHKAVTCPHCSPDLDPDYYTAKAEAERWQRRAERLEAALLEVRNERKPQVCAGYELCTHDGCRASYAAFAIADRALEASETQERPGG